MIVSRSDTDMVCDRGRDRGDDRSRSASVTAGGAGEGSAEGGSGALKEGTELARYSVCNFSTRGDRGWNNIVSPAVFLPVEDGLFFTGLGSLANAAYGASTLRLVMVVIMVIELSLFCFVGMIVSALFDLEGGNGKCGPKSEAAVTMLRL